MADRKTNLLITMVFDKDLDIGKQIDTELALKKEITKDLQHLITGREIKHFIIADDEVINKKLTEERKVGKWVKKYQYGNDYCSECNYENCGYGYPKFCPNCGAEMVGAKNG